MIESWLRIGRISQAHAVGAFYLIESGCLSCHTYRVAGAQELNAPDLTHIGRSMRQARLIAAIKCPTCVDPASPMPAFASLPKRTLDALTAFLVASH
jgi:hypothetical protein